MTTRRFYYKKNPSAWVVVAFVVLFILAIAGILLLEGLLVMAAFAILNGIWPSVPALGYWSSVGIAFVFSVFSTLTMRK